MLYTVLYRKDVHPSYSIRDEKDQCIGMALSYEHATLIVRALNYLGMTEFNWSCGHIADAVCGQCHDELAQRADEWATAAQLATNLCEDLSAKLDAKEKP